MKNYHIHLLRHGLTAANAEGRYVGSTDLPLSKEGRQELERLKREYEYPEVQRVYASPLRRCVETAELLYPDREIKKIDALREYDFGIFENRAISELKTDPQFLSWLSQGMTASPEGAESRETFTLRYERGFRQILREMMADSVTRAAVITHAGIITGLLAAHGLPRRENAMEWAVESGCGYTVSTSSQLWSMSELFEVFDRLPYSRTPDQSVFPGYRLIDLEEDE